MRKPSAHMANGNRRLLGTNEPACLAWFFFM